MAGELGPADDLAQLVGPERQLAAGRDPRVLLAQRARGRVAGVDEQPLAGLLLAPVQLLERGDGHVDLAPHLEHVRGAGRQPLGDDGDGGDVGGDVLADLAVAAGGGLHQAAALVAEAHGQPVDLELADVARRRTAEAPADARAPRRELRPVEGVVQAHHRHAVDDGRERGRRPALHPLRRRVRHDQVGVLLLQRPQLDQQGVVLGVGHLRRRRARSSAGCGAR